MTGLSIQYDLKDLAKLQARFANLAAVNTQPLAEEIGEFVLSNTQLNFENQQTPEGEAWEPSQRAISEGGKTLIDRGHLRDSYNYSANDDQVEIGSNSVYSLIHHAGGEAGRNLAVTLPARPALGITPEMEDDIGDMALAFYAEAFND